MHITLETNTVICTVKEEVLQQTDSFSSCRSSSLCRLEACSLSLALQWAQTWYDLNKRAGVRDEAIFFPLTQSSCFQTLDSAAGSNLCMWKSNAYTHIFTGCRCLYIMTPAEVFGSYYIAGACTHLSISFTRLDIVSNLFQTVVLINYFLPLLWLKGHDCLSMSNSLSNRQ